LVELLVRVLDRVSPHGIAGIAEQVGREYGQELAASIGAPDDPGYEEVLAALVKVMSGVGFELSADPDAQVLLTSHCPFGEAATGHPEVVCSLDRGMVSGIMGALHHACNPVVFPHIGLEDDCVTQVPVTISGRN
jgi:predicted ArsR family transcriptional regulator